MLSKDILKNVKLVVFDLDGTLLNDHNEIGEETIKYVKGLKRLGVEFSFASGRLPSAVLDHARELDIHLPMITLDGALIKSYPDGDTVFESYILDKHVKRAIKVADKYLLNLALCHDEAIYYTEDNSVIPKMTDKLGANFKEINSYNNYIYGTLEIIAISEYWEPIKYMESKMTFPYSLGLSAFAYKSHSHKDLYYLEIRKRGCSKGNGLKRLVKNLNIKMSDTVVMGDWYNDRTLFQTNAVKVAVANAVPEIKRAADFITKRDNNEDGVAEFLKMIIQSKV